MAFPTVETADVQHGVVTSNSTSWTLTYPTNLVSGDLIVGVLALDGTGTTTTWPAGWLRSASASAANVLVTAKKLSNGTETGTFSVTTPSEQGGWRVLRITGWEGTLGTDHTTGAGGGSCQPAAGGTGVTGTDSSPNITSGNPNNWDAEDTLWIACCSVDTSRTFSAWPSGYTPGDNTWDDVSGGAGGASLSVQYRQVNASSEDPGAWTISASDDWVATLVAVRPAAAAALVGQQGFVNFGSTAVLMGGIRRAWHRRRSGIFVPDHEWVTA